MGNNVGSNGKCFFVVVVVAAFRFLHAIIFIIFAIDVLAFLTSKIGVINITKLHLVLYNSNTR